MTGQLGFARPGEEGVIREIYALCFPEDGAGFWDWLFSRTYRPENTLTARQDGRIVASLQMLPCEMVWQGRQVPAHYIYAASTHPDWQGRGWMGRLLEEAAREGRRRGHWFSVLITQEDSLLDYYARFGYFSRLLAAQGAPQRAGEPGAGDCRQAVPGDIPALNGLYEGAASGLLHGLRTPEHWRLQLELFGGGAWVWQREGAVTGYAFSDERGIVECAGPDGGLLASRLAPGRPFRTVGEGKPMGSIRPLTGAGEALLAGKAGYLNLMYN